MNPVFNMMGQMGGMGQGQDMMSILIGKFGTMQNAMKQLNSLMGKRGMNPREAAIQELKGKSFSDDTINQFRTFARQCGMSDQQIDSGLREVGIIK